MGKHREANQPQSKDRATVGDETPVSGCTASGRQRRNDQNVSGPLATRPQEGTGGTPEGEYDPDRVSELMYDYAGLDEDIQALIRAPFRRVLAEWVRGAPTAEDFRDLAERQPDRAMQAGAIAAKMAGYQESNRVEHEHNINVKIAQMSDAELELEYDRLLADAITDMSSEERQKLFGQFLPQGD